MKRSTVTPRNNWHRIVEAQGLLFHSNHNNTPYWDESACFEFSAKEIERLERAANELHAMFLEACKVVVRDRRYAELGIPENLHRIITQSWCYDDWELHGRFDFTLAEDGTPKLLEYNADTPTGLLEAALIQWHWKEDFKPSADQFNSLHEALVDRWKALIERNQIRREYPLYLTSVSGHTEDRMTIGYMGAIAEQAGLTTQFIPIREIGWHSLFWRFVDGNDEPIRQMFKLYPWEWMGTETFGAHLGNYFWRVVEPPWKILCASKGMLLLLDELFPGHLNLLKVSRQPDRLRSHARKPFFGREGRNVELVVEGKPVESVRGPYQEGPFIYQEYCPLIRNDSHHAQLGVWMVGPEACGLGIREDTRSILSNTSRFVPHIIVG